MQSVHTAAPPWEGARHSRLERQPRRPAPLALAPLNRAAGSGRTTPHPELMLHFATGGRQNAESAGLPAGRGLPQQLGACLRQRRLQSGPSNHLRRPLEPPQAQSAPAAPARTAALASAQTRPHPSASRRRSQASGNVVVERAADAAEGAARAVRSRSDRQKIVVLMPRRHRTRPLPLQSKPGGALRRMRFTCSCQFLRAAQTPPATSSAGLDGDSRPTTRAL